MTYGDTRENLSPSPCEGREISPRFSQTEKIRLAEARRAAQEQFSWQSLHFFLIVQGILIAGALSHTGHTFGQVVVAMAGFVSSAVFAQLYLRARSFELMYSLWLRSAGRLDQFSFRDEVLETEWKREREWKRVLERDPRAISRGFRRRWRAFQDWLANRKSRNIWPLLFFVAAIAWVAYGVYALV